MAEERPRLVVGISGASGVAYGIRALDALGDLGVETHLVVSRAAAMTLKQETRLTPAELAAKASVVHRVGDVGAYAGPQTVDELIDQSVGRALDLFGLSWGAVRRWGRDVGPIAGAGEDEEPEG